MNYFRRIFYQILGHTPPQLLQKEEIASFFDNPCWFRLRQEAAHTVDMALHTIFVATDMNTVAAMRGLINGAMLILNETELRNTFKKSVPVTDFSLCESKIADLNKLLEELEHGNE